MTLGPEAGEDVNVTASRNDPITLLHGASGRPDHSLQRTARCADCKGVSAAVLARCA
jgi:hypothetical protein